MASAMARHILVAKPDLAEQIKQRLQRGEDFAMLAKKYSTCASKKRKEVAPSALTWSTPNAS